MNLLDFARAVKDGSEISDQEYVDLMKRVVPLDELRGLSAKEAEWFVEATTWLYDYAILVHEFAQSKVGKGLELDGHPCLPGSPGPFIENILTRGDELPDFGQLETYGILKNSE